MTSIEDFKSEWQSSESSAAKDLDTIHEMATKQKNQVFNRVNLRFAIELISFTILAIVYDDWFDLNRKPSWAYITFVIALGLFIINHVIALVSLNIETDYRLKDFIANKLRQLRKLSKSSLVVSGLFAAAFIASFSSGLDLNRSKIMVILALVIINLVALVISQKKWSSRISHLEQILEDLK